ncbi:MAG: Clostripain family protein [Firmicutes bacterium]|nr:Clostripain family protein [Bacillota bacterium]
MKKRVAKWIWLVLILSLVTMSQTGCFRLIGNALQTVREFMEEVEAEGEGWGDDWNDEGIWDEEDGWGESSQGSGSSYSGGSGTSEGLTLTVDGDSGNMTISRPELSEIVPMGAEGTWTIFVYLCGSDLESDYGMATDDMMEMVNSGAGGNVRFVVECGGAYSWENNISSSRSNKRILIENGQAVEVGSVSRSNMGATSTLADFLSWGVANYPAEKMGVVLWNHGGGSITGVCFDETASDDSLSLREIDAALLSVFGSMTDKFEFIGFDACLMGTIETANIMASYADYMYGSQEMEPGSGWDYESIGSFLMNDPSVSGAELGKVVCDSFLASCRAVQDDDLTTLAVIDLSKVDPLIEAFNTFASSMYSAGEDQNALTAMVRGIEAADNFGGNNRAEGYTNMVDLGGIIEACAPYTDGAEALKGALSDAVLYQVQGLTHQGASGLSIYYPLRVEGSEELTIFSKVCVSPYYLSFIDRQTHGSVNYGDTGNYTDEYWFDTNNFWNWISDYFYDETTGSYEVEDSTDSYWDYTDDYEQTGESPLITFENPPQWDSEGYYWFSLTEEGWNNAADVYGYVYQLSADGENIIELGETYDVYVDWEENYFCDMFDGYWLSLPDGQNLATYISDVTDEYVIYSSPILLNDEEVYLRLRQDFDDWSVTVEGVWNGISDSGASGRTTWQIQNGDVIVPLYYAYFGYDMEDGEYIGWEYTVNGDLAIDYAMMEEGVYYFAFCIDDIYGDYYMTDFVTFEIDRWGDIYYYED